MSELIPTPIVDVNGKQTTVHRRASQSNGNASGLATLRPTVASSDIPAKREPKPIKGDIHPDSVCLQVPYIKDSKHVVHDLRGNCKIAGDGVILEDDELYSFLRFGIDSTDAAVFKLCGYTPSDLTKDPEINALLPGHLARVFDGYKDHIFSSDEQIDIMIDAGIPASKAATVLRNGVMTHHFEGVLSVDEVVDLFMSSSYNRNPRLTGANKSIVLDAIVSGDIPFELAKRLKVANLQSTALDLQSHDGYRLRAIRDDSPSRFETLIVKAARCKSTPLALHDLTRKHSNRVLELTDPFLADKRIGSSSDRYGFDNAQYLESIKRAAPKDGKMDWVPPKNEGYTPFGKPMTPHQLRGEDMVAMREAGATPKQCWELLDDRRMRLEEALAVVRGETIIALAEGVL